MSTTTLTLAQFLLARIAEDEAAATTALADEYVPGRGWFNRRERDCEAKRQLVQRSLDLIASFGDWDARRLEGGRMLWTDVNRRERAHAHDTLCWLAAIYADHPDYSDDWL